MNFYVNRFLDNSTLEGEIFEIIFQTIFWSSTLSVVDIKLHKWLESHPWYDSIKHRRGGSHEFLTLAHSAISHFCSGSMALIGFLLNNTSMVRHGTLTEMAYEIFDL